MGERKANWGALSPPFPFLYDRREGAVSSIDLVLLGLLAREKQSAYDLARHITRYDVGGVIRLSVPAIYKNVKNLFEHGYLNAREERKGEMPEKTIYSLTESGREYFFTLMEKYATERVRYRFDFNSVVMNLDRVPKKRRERLIGLMKEQLAASRRELASSLTAWKKKLPMAEAIQTQVELVNEALLSWINTIAKKN